MNRTLKTAGVSLALLTACLSANTVFADGQDKADISCSLSFKGDSTNIGWDAPQKDQITSYKLYVSEPLSPDKCYLTDIPLKYVEDSSKLTADSKTYEFKDLEKGKYYRFKLEAYKDSELVGSDSLGSIVLGEDSADRFKDLHFDFNCIDLHTINIVWINAYKDNVKRSMKFYRIDNDGFHDLGTADFNAETYTFKDLESGKRYSVAAEVYEGEKMIFTYQFGFSTEKVKSEGSIGDFKDRSLELDVIEDLGTQICLYTEWEQAGLYSSLPYSDITYKIKLSEPLSSKDFFAGKKTSYKTYNFAYSDIYNYYIPFSAEKAFDQFRIYKEAESGMHYSGGPDGDEHPENCGFRLSGLEPGKYYNISAEAYYKGKLVASDKLYFPHDTIDYHGLFFDEEDDCNLTTVRAGSKDGKNVVLTWDNMPKTYDYEYPKGKRIINFYLSSPYKNKKKIYDPKRSMLSAKYAGKTAYNDLKYTLKGLTPGRHYMVYLEVCLDGKIEECFEYELSTTVNVPVIDVKLTKKNAVELSSSVGVSMHDLGLVFEHEYDIKFDNTCIKPEFVEYYRKEKNGKLKKIGTAAAGKKFVDKNVSLGKKYTYKARAYSIIGGKKIYSDYSPDLYNTIRPVNSKPKLKISYIDKKKNIVKITSDKNNAGIRFDSDNKTYYKIDSNKYYAVLSDDFELMPGKSVYLDLPKKKKVIGFDYSINYHSNYYTVTLGPKVSIS